MAMNLPHGLRQADIARRKDAFVSWLDCREYMPGRELDKLYSEGFSDAFSYATGMLTQLALSQLVEEGTIRQIPMETFLAYSLIDPNAASSLNPLEVELTQREMALMTYLGLKRYEPRSVAELMVRFDVQDNPDSWLTSACLTHLAKNGLIQAIGNPPEAYILPGGTGL